MDNNPNVQEKKVLAKSKIEIFKEDTNKHINAGMEIKNNQPVIIKLNNINITIYFGTKTTTDLYRDIFHYGNR